MALGKWKFGSLGKKHSASSDLSDTTIGTTTPIDSYVPEPPKRPSRLTRSFTKFRHRAKKSSLSSLGGGGSEPEDQDAYARLHKPFTPENLEHQKILSAFEWNFGRTLAEPGCRRTSMEDISPSASRCNSIDWERVLPPSSRRTGFCFETSHLPEEQEAIKRRRADLGIP
ncbi:hypothetical protein GGR56DRAFT_629316 [Xylariaceae sp. FL0804]|nr:hypothetical protein GGR56DRAFT_629316 [Xylariaceae sp. FL0804]